MTEFNEDDFLMISGIQHYTFCRRQWALIHIEQQWCENFYTVDGEIMHEKVHDASSFEKRKSVLISRGMAIQSYEYGITGSCDVVEFHEDKNGVPIQGRPEKYLVIPVEYKRGSPKENEADIFQLIAQIICLEEMFCTTIQWGAIYYGETRKRLEVEATEDLKNRVKTMIFEMHDMFKRGYTPKVKPTKACHACSLQSICVPNLLKSSKQVKQYIEEILQEKDDA